MLGCRSKEDSSGGSLGAVGAAGSGSGSGGGNGPHNQESLQMTT